MATTETMDIKWNDRDNVADTDFREYAEGKLDQLEKLWNKSDETHLRVSLKRGLVTVEITLFSGGIVMRGEERADNVRLAFDNAFARLERQLHRYKKKARARRRSQNNRDDSGTILNATADALHESDEAEPQTPPVRVKRFAVKPMTPEEASLQMELLGHSFFVFRNADNHDVHVVYKRGDGGYGLIETVSD